LTRSWWSLEKVVAAAILLGLLGFVVGIQLGSDLQTSTLAEPPETVTVVRTKQAAAETITERRTVTEHVTATVAAEPTTVVVTETVTAPSEEERTPVARQPVRREGSIGEGIALTDQSTALLGQGEYRQALAVGRRALAMLQGSSHIYEAYVSYDVGRALVALGRCEEALPHLVRSERLQGPRPLITATKRQCS
jgi:hypothetical protein